MNWHSSEGERDENLIKRILVPLDGSEPAEKALDFALDLAEKYGASIEIMNVLPIPTTPGHAAPLFGVPPTAPTWLSTYSKELKTSSKKMLSKALKKAKKNKAGLRISTKLVEGRPSEEITKTAKEGSFDIIVMGSRGIGGVKEFLLGSVSNRVSHDAECPVLIVK